MDVHPSEGGALALDRMMPESIFDRDDVRQAIRQRLAKRQPSIPVSRCLHSTLTFIIIAAEELQPRYMRGYGEISNVARADLNQIAAELLDLTAKFDRYVTREIQGTPSAAQEVARPEGDDKTC
jgi:hypothetical protein